MSEWERSGLISLTVILAAFLLFFIEFAVRPRPDYDAGSTALCEVTNRFPKPEQDAWDFWMGPYSYFPCKQLPLEANV